MALGLVLAIVAALALYASRGGLDRWFRRRLLPQVEVNGSRIGPARAAFEDAASELGLSLGVQGMSFVLEGTHDSFFVQAAPLGLIIGEGHGSADVRVTLDAESCVRHELWLYSRTGSDPERDPHGRKPIATGDDHFDARYSISGPETLVRALLGRRHRRSLLQLEGHLTVKEGRVIYTARCLAKGGPGVVEAVKSATVLARSLTIEKDAILDQLLDNARSDQDGGVRLANLLVVLREHKSSADLAETCRLLLGDPLPSVRLEAAIALGEEGLPACVMIARSMAGISGAIRGRAFRHLARHLPFEASLPIFKEALGDPDREVRLAAIKALGALDRPEIAGALVTHLRVADPEEARAVALALGRVRSTPAETVLVRLLDHDWIEVQSAAVTSLSKVGTPSSLPALSAHRDRAPNAARRAIDDAISSIKSRARAEPGRLSFSDEPEGGALSVAHIEGGALSPPAEDPLEWTDTARPPHNPPR